MSAARLLSLVLALAGAPTAPGAVSREMGREGHAAAAARPLPSLAAAYRGSFLVGAAITPTMLSAYGARRFVERQFDVIVDENGMKPLELTGREGEYDFSATDALVDWANQHGIKVRGHCLIWHRDNAPWMFLKDGAPVPREVLVQRMREYIHAVVGHFKGRVWAWDVVKEALVAHEPEVASVDGWRRSAWYDTLGPEYVELAFRFAREADPGALLFYNDYETQDPAKRSLLLGMVRSLQAKGIRIDGVGHQSHYTVAHGDPTELENTIRAVAALGLRNHITEMDISLRDRWDAPVPVVTKDLRALQARLWAEFFRMFRRNADSIDAVLTWGVNDEGSWLRAPDEPLLFSNFRPKPTFWAVLREAWRKPDVTAPGGVPAGRARPPRHDAARR
jgi:endo-1,4-beta-xylanase